MANDDEGIEGAEGEEIRDDVAALLRELARTSDVLSTDLVGRRLNRFVLEARLGAGGMGVVYRARDEKLGRDVALKVLAPTLAQDERAKARLLREARAAAVIQHANVATVFDVGEDDGIAWIALELVEGLSLRERMRRATTLSLHEVRVIARGVAAALAAAHEAGVVHRDLKPDNIVLTHTSGVKVLDFGLARRVDDEAASEPLTREGEVLGTLGYLSPEQALGKPLDARSDVFSFGVLAYEMLIGTLPFKGTTFGEAAVALSKDPLPGLRERRADIPLELATLVERCLQRAPEDRFADGSALLVAVEHATGNRDASAADHRRTTAPRSLAVGGRSRPPAERVSLAGRALIAGAMLLLVLAGVFAGARWSTWVGPPEPVSLASIPKVSSQQDVQRDFRLAAQSFYAGDMAAAARGLDEVLAREPESVPVLALRILAGRPETGGRTRDDMLRELERASRSAPPEQREVGAYLAALWRRMNVDAEGHSIAADVSSLLAEGEALLSRRQDDYFADLLLTASLPTADIDARIKNLDALLARDDGPAVVWLWKVWSLLRADRADDAASTLEEALRRHPGSNSLNREVGFVAAMQGHYLLAERELRRVIDADPTDTYARIELAGVFFEVGKEGAWRAQLEAVLDGTSRAAPAGRAVLASVTALLAQGRFAESASLIERAFSVLEDGGRYDIAGEFLRQRASEELWIGRASGARRYLARIEEILKAPKLDDGARRRLQGDLLRLGAELALLEGDDDAAREHLVRLESLSPDHFPPESDKARSLSLLNARLAARANEPELAIDAFEQAHKSPRHSRDDEEALTFLGRLWREMGRGVAADDAYARVLEQRKRCETRTLWWEALCRVRLAEAAVSRAELARARGDISAARAHLDELARIWPRADDDLPLVVRARVVQTALRESSLASPGVLPTTPP